MRVAAYPADLGGCGMYRVIWPAEALVAQGADIDLVHPDDPAERQIQGAWDSDGPGRRLVDVVAPDADVVVLQRPLTDVLAQAIPLLQAKGVKIVVEIDDDFETISPRNVSWRVLHPKESPRRNWLHLRQACDQADLVVVSTPALAARYGRHGRVAVVPNLVPARYLGLAGQPRDGVFVGWSGSLATHPDDLQVTGGGVGRAIARTGARFAVVGTGKGVQGALGLPEPPLACGWVPIDDYPTALAQLDVGVVPLELSAFNEAKSWLKGLELSAVGVPFVASPTGPYRDLVALGAGVLAERPREWEGVLKRLILDAGWRAELAARGRETAARLTIEAGCDRWWDAWSSPVNTRCAA